MANTTETLQVDFRDYQDKGKAGYAFAAAVGGWLLAQLPEQVQLFGSRLLGLSLVLAGTTLLAVGIGTGAELGFFALPASFLLAGFAITLVARASTLIRQGR